MPTNPPKTPGTTGEEKLRKCPFCPDGKQRVAWDIVHYWVVCSCGARGRYTDSIQSAVAAWNRRTSSRPIAMPTNETIAEATELLKHINGCLNAGGKFHVEKDGPFHRDISAFLARIGSAQSAGSGTEGEGR